MLLCRWNPMVYIVFLILKINYWLKFGAVKLYYLKGCVIMTSKQEGGGVIPVVVDALGPVVPEYLN